MLIKQKPYIIGAVVLAVLVLLGVISSFSKGKMDDEMKMQEEATTTQNTTANTQTTKPQSSQTQQVSGVLISVKSMQFAPQAVTVKKGTKVTWRNDDSLVHNVSAMNSGGPTSGPLLPGKTYSYTFNVPGIYSYECTLHPGMRGTIVVQ